MSGLISLIIYDVFIFLDYKAVFPSKRSHWLYGAAALAVNIGVAVPAYLLLDPRFAIYLIIGSVMLAIHLLFYVNYMQTLYVGSIYMFSLYSSMGIVFSLYSIIFHTSIKDIFLRDIQNQVMLPLVVLLSIAWDMLSRKLIVTHKKAGHLLHNRRQLKFVVIYLFFQLLFLTLINDGRYYDNIRSSAWFTVLYLGACIISKLWLLFVLHHTTQVSELFEYELYTYQLQDQLSRQMRHYQSYRKYTESYRAFRHDYENLMASLKALLNRQEYKKAIRMLDGIHDTMQRNVLVHKSYSDNIILDAILKDAADVCEEKNIHFSAHAYLPETVPMTELDIVRVFANIINNAIEACNKLSGQERFVEVKSNGNQNWVIIEITNSFNGELLIEGDEPETTKEDKDLHGFGLRIIKETIESLGGLVVIDPDKEKRVFKIRVCMPQTPYLMDFKEKSPSI